MEVLTGLFFPSFYHKQKHTFYTSTVVLIVSLLLSSTSLFPGICDLSLMTSGDYCSFLIPRILLSQKTC